MGWSLVQATVVFLGLSADPFAAAVAVLVGFTTLFGTMAHYGAVLAKQSKHTVEYCTGVGVFIGASLGTAVLVLDLLS